MQLQIVQGGRQRVTWSKTHFYSVSKKFWEELVAYFHFTIICVFDTSRKNTLVCMQNEVSVGITNERDLWRCYWNGFRWQGMHIKFHVGGFRHWSNIKVITSTISESTTLVLVMGEVYEVRQLNGLRWHDIHVYLWRSIQAFTCCWEMGADIQTVRCSHMPTFIFYK
jgi:hypothetical protein